ncbi:DUF3108 domain-containing protein [Sulfurimonas sp.]
MKKFFLFLLLSSLLLAQKTVEKVKFDSAISLYGKVGDVTLVFEQDLQKKWYRIEASSAPTGLVKILSGNRRDTFISEGKIVNGVYKPQRFIKKSRRYKHKEEVVYSFDYKKRTVVKIVSKEEQVTHKTYDFKNFKIIKKIETKKKHSRKKIAFVPNDYLSLYLNLVHHNLHKGLIRYVDQSKSNRLMLLDNTHFKVEKDHGKKSYKIILTNDKNSIFFKEACSLDVAFYGNAYIRKILDQKTEAISKNSL